MVPGAPTHSNLTGVERLVDSHFRLLREDFLGKLRPSLQTFMRIVENSVDNLRLGKTGRLLVSDNELKNLGLAFNSNDIELLVFQNLRIGSIDFDSRSGAFFNIEFDMPPIIANANSEKRNAFLEKVLMSDQLLSLVLEDISQHRRRIVFVTIVNRGSRTFSQSKSRVSVGVRALTNEDITFIARCMLAPKSVTTTHYALQSSSIYFESYRSVLEVLKSCTPGAVSASPLRSKIGLNCQIKLILSLTSN